MSVVQSHLPWHLAGAAGFIKLPIIRTLVLDTVEPLPQLVRKLNDFKPHVLGRYASNVHLLAQEQIEGRLNVALKTILTTAETLEKEARTAIKKTWGIEPYEAYRSTKIGEAAAECEEHNGLHIFDDLLGPHPEFKEVEFLEKMKTEFEEAIRCYRSKPSKIWNFFKITLDELWCFDS